MVNYTTSSEENCPRYKLGVKSKCDFWCNNFSNLGNRGIYVTNLGKNKQIPTHLYLVIDGGYFVYC